MSASNQHSDLFTKVRVTIGVDEGVSGAAQHACEEARSALDAIEEQHEDLLRQRIELQNSIGGNIVTIDKLCEQRGEAWSKLARLEEQLEAAQEQLRYATEPADPRWTGLTDTRRRAYARTDWTGPWPLASDVKSLLDALDIIYDRSGSRASIPAKSRD